MYFIGILIGLDIPDPAIRLTATHGIYAHAAIMSAISAIDAEAGRTLHDMKRHKRLTLAALHEKGKQPALRLTFFTEAGLAYANKLINALAKNPTLALGGLTCRVSGVDLSDQAWAGVRTWSDFVVEKPSARLGFRFITPTAFTKKDKDGKRFMSVLPEPLDIFNGLSRRWKTWGGPPLAEGLEDFIKSGGIVIASHWLSTLEFDDVKHPQIGFVGQVVYLCRTTDRAMLKTINGLAHIAPFVGVGYQTSRGMGTVQVKLLG